MIPAFVKAWDEHKDYIEAHLKEEHPENYKQLVTWVIEMINPLDEYDLPDPKRIVEINQGDYQGTLVYVIGATGYQPNDYWYARISYGSCSGCDTLEWISSLEYDDKPTEKQIKEYMTLALHIVQRLKKMDDMEDYK